MDQATQKTAERLTQEWATWVIEDEGERHNARLAATYDEMKLFYDAMMPHAGAMLEQLSRCDASPDKGSLEWRLFLLMLSVGEIAQPIELYQQARVPRGFDPARLVPSAAVNERYHAVRFGL